MKIFKDHDHWSGVERRNPQRIIKDQITKIASRFRFSNLRKKLIIYFFLIIFVTFSIGVQFIFEIGSPRLHMKITKNISHELKIGYDEKNVAQKVAQVHRDLQKRMVLIMFLVFLCTIATMFLFVRNIVDPLDDIGEAARRMADGHLDETVPVRTLDEIGKIGELINDLAVNLQEVLLHVWNHTKQDSILLQHITEVVDSGDGTGLPEGVKEKIHIVKQDVEEMKNMVKTFDFYNIRFEQGEVVASDSSDMEG